ncbi:uncharacterized protein LOC108043655 [Drosophila rhopaloa]|uniref:Uncharacterized protein LOC108043655 n=1 Tax=Drosophila rhopaloa TaxID=1041015 RepID=A0A6P4EMW0_DRORH|nr:uncharacterized protein LOC108043655 [Drosophila rhopaloa]
MEISSSSVQHLVVLGTIILAISLAGVHAEKKIRIKTLEKSSENSEYLHSHLRISEYEENVVKINGELKLHKDIDNDWTIQFKVFRSPLDGGESHLVVDLNEMHVCDTMKTYYKDFFYDRLKEYSNAPHPSTCPVPAEHYKLEDYPLDVHLLKKLMTPGRYESKFNLFKGHHEMLSYTMELEVE